MSVHLTSTDLDTMERIQRINIINSITGIKPANLIGTVGKNGRTNLAIFSSVVHLGSDPPLIGMVSRPIDQVPRHTFQNIMDTSFFTINHVPQDMTEQAHYTSAKFKEEVSEFEQCHFTEEYLTDFSAPFVKESQVKIGLKLEQIIPIEVNGTILLIGRIQHILFPKHIMNEQGYLNLTEAKSIGISGLNSYYELAKVAQYPYARPHELPTFKNNKG